MEEHDVVIIGAGIMGACIAFELAKMGRRPLVVDKLPAAGHGSTANTCAIVRMSYSTHEGVTMAWEGLHYWESWESYLETADELGFARLIATGEVLLKADDGHWQKVAGRFAEVGVPYEEWSLDRLKERFPFFHGGSFGPPRRPDDPTFYDEPDGEIGGALYTPGGGYVNDPLLSVHNVQRAAEARGAEFLFNAEVVEIRRDGGRVAGVTLNDGTTDRRTGGGQRRRTPLLRHQPDGRGRGGHEDQDPGAAPRGPPRARPSGLRLRERRAATPPTATPASTSGPRPATTS